MTLKSQISNPFATGTRYFGIEQQWTDAESRRRHVKTFSMEQCRAALKLSDLQRTVRMAIERRMRALEKNK